MKSVSFQELTETLSARADSLAAGVAPTDRVLAGARRRAARRKAAVAVAGTMVIVGVAGGLGVAFGGGHGSGMQQVPPAQRSSSAFSGSPRHIPAFTQQDGQGDVVASGMEDGVAWQLRITARPGPDGGEALSVALMKGGAFAGGGSTDGGLHQGDIQESAVPLIQGPGSAWVFLVTPNITDVAWTGADGFRYDQATLAARPYGVLGEMRLAVFPSSLMNVQVGDQFVGYDAAGRKVGLLGMLSAPPS